MNYHFALNRFLPSLASLLLGVVASGATLAFYRGNPFDLILIGGVLYVLGFLAGSLLLSALLWLIARVVIGPLGRHHFQIIWVACAAVSQFLVAALTTYDLRQLGVFDEFFTRPDILPRLIVLVFPYLATISSVATLLNDESAQERGIRIAELRVAESEYRAEKSQPRVTALVPIFICIIIGGALGWAAPIASGANAFTSILLAATGIPVGMTVHRYLPAQRKLRSLERKKARLR